jgi:hypothetical protein
MQAKGFKISHQGTTRDGELVLTQPSTRIESRLLRRPLVAVRWLRVDQIMHVRNGLALLLPFDGDADIAAEKEAKKKLAQDIASGPHSLGKANGSLGL